MLVVGLLLSMSIYICDRPREKDGHIYKIQQYFSQLFCAMFHLSRASAGTNNTLYCLLYFVLFVPEEASEM